MLPITLSFFVQVKFQICSQVWLRPEHELEINCYAYHSREVLEGEPPSLFILLSLILDL